MGPFAGCPSLPPVVTFSLFEPSLRPHLRDEIQVIIKVLVNVTETIQQAASGTLITFPAPIQPLLLYARSDRTLRIPPALPAGRTVQLSDPPQNGEKYGIFLEFRDLRGFIVGVEVETDFHEFLIQGLDQMEKLFIGGNAVRAAQTATCRRIPVHFGHTRFTSPTFGAEIIRPASRPACPYPNSTGVGGLNLNGAMTDCQGKDGVFEG
jgi:hypothetical protein